MPRRLGWRDEATGLISGPIPECSDPPEESCADAGCPIHGWDDAGERGDGDG